MKQEYFRGTTEKERVLNLLIDQVRYDGGTARLEIDFKLSGIAGLAEEDRRSARSFQGLWIC